MNTLKRTATVFALLMVPLLMVPLLMVPMSFAIAAPRFVIEA
jgi:hypothetical protein